MSKNLIPEFKDRGILYQITDPSLEKHLSEGSRTLYCGFDPTSDSLHVGSLFPLLTLKRFQMAGHRPIVVLGGATGMIGDPSGKSAERQLQTPEQVAKNLVGIKKVAEKFLDFTPGKPNSAIIIDNNEFYKDMDMLRFLREVGKHFTVNYMMQKDSVKGRMEDRDHGISYTEFSYMLLQSYDYYCLNQKFDCTLQIGASDQWGNITAGAEYIRKRLAHDQGASYAEERIPAFGMTHPLIKRPDGVKFGKTEQGTIWLTADKTSSFQFYQFFIQSPDTVVIEWIKFLTFLPMSEIAALEEQLKTAPEKKAAQIALATELTKIVHGEDAVKRVQAATNALFGTEIKELDLQTINEVFGDAPSTKKAAGDLAAGIPLIDLLVETELFQSKGAARKEIPAGGVYLNNERVTDIAFTVKRENLIAGAVVVLRKGKKNYHVVRFG